MVGRRHIPPWVYLSPKVLPAVVNLSPKVLPAVVNFSGVPGWVSFSGVPGWVSLSRWCTSHGGVPLTVVYLTGVPTVVYLTGVPTGGPYPGVYLRVVHTQGVPTVVYTRWCIPGCYSRHLSERETLILKTRKKTLEWSTILTVLTVLIVSVIPVISRFTVGQLPVVLLLITFSQELGKQAARSRGYEREESG